VTSRARATALALVNWKGVFYERYQLDRRVTALEGANGAGKTTVMIAAYIVLLPDMTRLRFTNLGETAATGGDRGIWGRLGEPTRPSYAALELDLGDGARLVAGVLLTRKAEPTVELSPFLIRDLAPQVRLQDLLLLRSADEESVPELAELRDNVTAAKGRLEVFGSAKDYFSALFELGISALRLASDEDRGRLGDMLRTSMTGGISRAITAELRSFLLREHGSTHDTLARMRENLSTCRRTRIEVSEAQLLEQEISGIYEAGQGMFAAALQATREREREHRQQAAELLDEVERARQLLNDATRAASELEAQERELASKLQEQRGVLDALREQSRLSTQVQALREKQGGIEQERLAAAHKAAEAQARKEQATARREAQKRQREAAQQNQERAALGLADLQAGLDELHRRSSAYRQAQRAQTEVAALYGTAPSSGEQLLELMRQAQARLAELDQQRLERERALTLSTQRQAEWTTALGLLGELGLTTEPEAAFERASAELRRLEALELDVRQAPALRERLAEQTRLSERQLAVRQMADALGLARATGGWAQRIEACITSADAEQARQEEQKRALEDERRRVSAERGVLQERIQQTQASLGKYRRLVERVKRVEAASGPLAPRRDALLRVRDSLASERQELQQRIELGMKARETALRDANELEAAGGHFPSELLKLRDELDGEVLGNRFEELDLPEAARLEALLGPLTQAIVVEDVARAVERLQSLPRELSELRLIAAGTELDFLRPGSGGDGRDVCVAEGPALRVTRRPERPSLGRKAREGRVEELRRHAAAMGEELERQQTRLRTVSSALGELDQLLPEVTLLEHGDPSQLQSELQVQEQERARDEQALDQTLTELAVRANETRQEAARYRRLLPDAYLLDGPDYGQHARELNERLTNLQHAEQALARAAEPRKKLATLLEALRVPPPTADELQRFEAERDALAAERDRAFRCIEALRQLERELPALAWQDAERALQTSERVAPALEEQHQRARAAVEEAEQLVLVAEQSWEQATLDLQREEAALAAIAAHAQRLAEELAGLGAAADLTPGSASARVAELTAVAETLAQEERELLARRGAQAERVRQLGEDLAEVEADLLQVQRAAEPAAQRWRALKAAAEAALVLHSGESSDHAEPPSSIELEAEARSRAELLADRLAGARGGEPLAQELSRRELQEAGDFLDVWLRVREWLARRVPAQVASVEDPLLALERLRGHLGVLEQRLAHQEADLRGTSEDVARGIEVQLRRAKAQVRRLNQNLDGVSFGSITGIRVELRRSQQMEPVLRALAEGSAQELLFQSSLPMEEALSEILRRFGGGRSGPGRVLDYREYLELLVEVQRKADGSWEAANPTRLSTGEAIGVGAALMMVILAEWERDANLLRPRRGPGSLRFLFLDEANRLSQDNLGSLFDLCQSLDLQLLIAAPEVARSDGNTTYRLVRKVTEDGREEVIVSGRRALGAEPEPPLAPPAVLAVQGSLFGN
jgi:chromosome partition protein MukB